MKRIILAAIATLAAAAAASAQQAAPKMPELSKMVETVEVHVINIDVVVTDRKGNPVTGLTKDDFTLLENGRPKPITNFYEVEPARPAATPATTPADTAQTPAAAPPLRASDIPDTQRRRIIFYIDNLSLAPFNRNRVFKQMKDFIAKVMRPGDEAMIATFNRSMKVRVPFTRDAVQLQQTLDIIAGESALGGSARSERKDTEGRIRDAQSYEEALSFARSYAESVEHDLRQSVSSLNGLIETVAGLEGKKVLVLTSEGFPMSPGREAFVFLDETGRSKNWGSASMLEGMSFDSHTLIESVARTANANNVTLYTIHAAGLGADVDNSAENAQPTSYTVTAAAASNSTESMQLMAEMTGGVASVQTNNFTRAFDRIRTDLDSYYSLGYRAGTERVDRQRSIEVKPKNRNYMVRSRQTFVEKSIFAEMNDRVIANLLYRTKSNDMKIVVKSDRPRAADDDLYRVPLEIQIPMDSLTFLPQGDVHVGGFDVYVVVANKEGDMSDVARRSQQITIPAADMPKATGKYYTYSLEMLMERGLNKISVGVMDNISNSTGFARDQVIAQDLR